MKPALTALALSLATIMLGQNVGIGTDVPLTTIHIKDTSILGASLFLESPQSPSNILMEADSGMAKSIYFRESGENKSYITHFDNALRFYLDPTPAFPYQTLSLASTNEVGINLPYGEAPTQKLDVRGKIRVGSDNTPPEAGTMRYNSITETIQYYDGNSWRNSVSYWAKDPDNAIISYPDGNVFIGRSESITSSEGFGITKTVSGSNYGGMYVETQGNATTKPFYGYAINGLTKAWHYFDGSNDTWLLWNSGNQLAVTNTGQLGIGTTAPEEELHVMTNTGNAGMKIQAQDGNANIRLDASNGSTGYSQLRFTENNALSGAVWYDYENDALTLYENGNAVYVQDNRVGLATLPNPNYRLSVNGKVVAEELKIQLQQNWPDYVFDENYDLLSITELSAFIEEHNHLPGVPSAEAIEADSGFEVGEMQRVLLEKIEELTLHIIRQQEEIDLLKKQLRDQ